MPGERTQIPSTIRRSAPHARRLWKKAHDSAVETYGEGSSAHRVAYAALKHEYRKAGNRSTSDARPPRAAHRRRCFRHLLHRDFHGCL